MIEYFTKHETAANLLMIAVYLLGIMGAFSMIRETLPEFRQDKITIRVTYRGAAPEEVEKSVCNLIEEAIDGVEGIDKVTSTAREGMATITVESKEDYDVDVLFRDIENEVDKIDNFPDDIEKPVLFAEKKLQSVISIAVAGDVDFRDLKKYGEEMRRDLLELEEISLVEIQGISELQIKIEIPQQTLRALGLTLTQVKDFISAQSGDLPVGSIESKDQEILLRLVDQKYSIREFGELLLPQARGERIQLQDVAKISWALAKEEQASYLNGKRAVILAIQKSTGEDALQIRRVVRGFVAQRQLELGDTLQIECIQDVARIIQDRLSLLSTNALQGILLVFLTLWLFLDLRLAFWVSMGIPFSLLGGLWVMQLCGLTINMITMVSLILGIGLIVDDAIVLGENIYTQFEQGKSPLEACIEGVRGVFSGVICSFLTTIAAFMPLLFLEGEIGTVLRIMPIGVIITLTMSLIEAFLVLPNHLRHSFSAERRAPSLARRKIEQCIEYVRNQLIGKAVHTCMNYRYLTCISVLMISCIAIGLIAGGRLSFVPFPELDGDVVICYCRLPSGTPLSKTRRTVHEIEAGIWRVDKQLTPLQPGQQRLVRNVNSTFGINKDSGEEGSHVTMVTIELLTSERRSSNCDEIIAAWSREVGEIADVESLKFAEMSVGPGGKPFEIQLLGDDLDNLSLASRQLQKKLDSYAGVYNTNDDLPPGKWQVYIKTLPLAKSLGFTSRDVFQQLNTSFFGGIVEEFILDNDEVEVRMLLAEKDRRSLADLEGFYLLDQQRRQVPLTHLVDLQLRRSYSNIHHVNGRRAVTVSADIDSRIGNAAEIIAELQNAYFAELSRKYDVKVRLEGQHREMKKTAASAKKGLLIGLIGIFVILSFIFRSYSQPIVIMATIPLGFAGAIFGHYLLGIQLCMPSMVGAISLSGIVVNDSIVLVQFMKDNVASGIPVMRAATEASVARFRAVFLTSATTIAGLLPLILERSLQAQILIPLAISIAFGLLFATILVLVFIPCLTVIFHDCRLLHFEEEQ